MDNLTGTVLRVLPGRVFVFEAPDGTVQRGRVNAGPPPRPRQRVRLVNDGRGWIAVGWA